MDETELNAIRSARLAELQKQALGSRAATTNASTGSGGASSESPSASLSNTVAQLLEPQARERLGRVRQVRPDRVEQIEQYLYKIYSMGQLQGRVSENEVVRLLESMRDEKPGVKIVYNRRHNEDSDSDYE
ncbi:uncharacterized protein KQ657_000695 [Scheffersomyces spartinae]|uniref:DNA-binding TFAR19-related protein n=1 Tax=Scheffersomyces spartinae TaxID=45513 RepID=A0A9P7V9C8_9ASCO|nr:uncharacterized protein KQ657_000695 [Scheffersomyces spartinae]KAG7193622.1 hypothetical protein KQ657_000695 [Scheffersomyces spartinae]